MEFRMFSLMVDLSKEEINRLKEKNKEYLKFRYNRSNQDISVYFEYSNSYNTMYFCSYPEEDKWFVYGDLVDSNHFDLELKRFKDYLDYIGVDLIDNNKREVKLIVAGENIARIKVIQNLMNLYFNYELMLNKVIMAKTSSLDEEEVDNINDLSNITDELPEDIIKLSIENKGIHKNFSPIDLSDYPVIAFKCYNLDIDSLRFYFQFLSALIIKASRHILVKKNRILSYNEKYMMRNLLRNLGFNGEKFKDFRKVFLKNLSGNIAFRNI